MFFQIFSSLLNRKLDVLPSNISFQKGKNLSLSKTISDGIYEAEYLKTPTSDEYFQPEVPASDVVETVKGPEELLKDFFSVYGNSSMIPISYPTRLGSLTNTLAKRFHLKFIL